MAPRLICAGILFAFGLLSDCQAACPPGSAYAAISSTHTMCHEDKGKEVPLTAEDIKFIVDKHNEIRAAVDPPAANMLKIAWNEDLAKTAAKLARLCTSKHDRYIDREEPNLPGVRIGQNLAMSSSFTGMSEAISNSFKMGWLDEKAHFTFGKPTQKTVGHYTQMITGDTALVGCGIADCSAVPGSWKEVKVCNYAPGQTTFTHPYKPAPRSCFTCPGMCSHNLCDCRGKVCLNGGVMENCKCLCPGIYTGERCETKTCPPDASSCQFWWDMIPNPCVYSNVQEECPKRCGLCG